MPVPFFTPAELAAMPDHRFTRLSREEVARRLAFYVQARRAQAYRHEVMARAIPLLGTAVGAAALDADGAVAGTLRCPCGEQRSWPSLPVPAYVAVVQRWAGGPPEADQWYFDLNSF